MTAQSTTNNKLGKLYAGLSEIERARLLARLWREKNGAELDRLRTSVPDDRAGKAYNEALAALRGLNSAFVLYQFMYLRTGFDRDFFAFHTLQIPHHEEGSARDVLNRLSDLLSYPVTQSEYTALVKRERATLLAVEDWADLIWGEEDLRPELQGLMTEYHDPYSYNEMSAEEREALLARYYARVGEEVRAAIDRDELPKPRKAPKSASIHATPDTIWLPAGALSDWAKGTTEETYPVTAGDAAPAIELFHGSTMKCEVLPDSEAGQVKARRAKLRDVLLQIGRYSLHIPQDRLDSLSFEPTRNEREWRRASDFVATLWKASDDGLNRDEALRSLMTEFAGRKATLRVLTDIIGTLQREIFGDEDSLDTDARKLLENAWESAKPTEEVLSLFHKMPLAPGVTEPWPELDDEAVYAQLRPFYEQHIRAGAQE